jgi:hypothetical protein
MQIQIGKIPNPVETATGIFGLGLRNERGDTLVEWQHQESIKS